MLIGFLVKSCDLKIIVWVQKSKKRLNANVRISHRGIYITVTRRLEILVELVKVRTMYISNQMHHVRKNIWKQRGEKNGLLLR